MNKIVPNLWFDNRAEEAARFYVDTFNSAGLDSAIISISYYGASGAEASGKPEGSVMVAYFKLGTQEFAALNGGPEFKFSPAVSFLVNCETQEEIDTLWEKLSASEKDEQCGWLKDKFGVSWQIVTPLLDKMLADKDPIKTERVMQAMLKMKKIDIVTLKKAYDGETFSEELVG